VTIPFTSVEAATDVGYPGFEYTHGGFEPRHVPSIWQTSGLLPFIEIAPDRHLI
jgi:hypothetical protein